MKHYGIDNQYILTAESVSTLPTWDSKYKRSFIFAEDVAKMYYGTNTGWAQWGTSGTSGTSGINGTSGTSGINGTSGTSGINGTSGTSGTSPTATSGTSGSSGTKGTSGTSGTSGVAGTSGSSGTSPTATSGTSGVSGTSGTSGTSVTAASTSWSGSTTNSTLTEIYVGGVASTRLTVSASSAMSFNITVSAKDNTGNSANAYFFRGVIKRDASNNTILSNVIKDVIEENTDFDCDVSADNANKALVIKVTGHASNTVLWKADGFLTTAI